MQNSHQHNLGTKGLQNPISNCPFIGLKIPFICHPKPLILPSIGKSRPFVCIRAITGFTLVELLVTLIIAAIMFSLAIPEMTSFIKNSRITTQTNDLLADLNLARSEAIKRNRNVVVCKSNNPTAATPACNTTDADPWSSGRLVFVDTDGSNTFTTAANDVLLRTHQSLTGSNSLKPDATTSSLKNFIAYSRNGLTTIATGSTQHFALCDDRGDNHARGVAFETTGRARIVRKSTFAALSCS